MIQPKRMSARNIIANYWLGEGGECLEDAYPCHRQVAYDRADEILSALAAAGYKIVSREATPEMCQRALIEACTHENKGIEFAPFIAWRAMFDATEPTEKQPK